MKKQEDTTLSRYVALRQYCRKRSIGVPGELRRFSAASSLLPPLELL